MRRALMHKDVQPSCNTTRGPHGATHPAWKVSRDAFIWDGATPKAPNLLPFAADMSLWTQRKLSSLPLIVHQSSNLPCQPSNPYTYSLATISTAIAQTLSEAIAFAESSEYIDNLSAEITRIRYESELVIFATRFCEAAIKQMLYCTNFPKKLYKNAGMGPLLSQECRPCKASTNAHDVSLLGALAHRYALCHTLDFCAFDHLALLARRRNLETAHSDAQHLYPRTIIESRSKMKRTILDIGSELGHMADHLGAIEDKMIKEINLIIQAYPSPPKSGDLWKIPVRQIDQAG